MSDQACDMLLHHWSSTKNLNKILVVYGLEHLPINCDMVFNLFCLYGNVMKVKILKNKMVLVEMQSFESASQCKDYLHKLSLGQDRKIEVKYSKHYAIHNEAVSNKLLDGTYAHKIYSTSKLNRFFKTSYITERRPTAPSKILHFFNAPTDITGLDVHQAISSYLESTEPIISITILPKTQKAKCSTGLIEFNDISHAVKAVLKTNHLLIKSSKSKYPFLMKLCFSNYYDISQITNNASSNDESPLLQCRSKRFTPWMLHNSEQATATTMFTISWFKVVGNDNSSWTLRQVIESDYKQTLKENELSARSNIVNLLKATFMKPNDLHDNNDDKGDNVDDHVEHSDVSSIGPLGDAGECYFC
ncbi:heterogeneous nuclear ribonucleoprotein L-like [Adelges cooleyi]|uniref:heterogeneous nuclear ribonucleoprotein L-like n=1 Tax=Adelges cooleyi TaxID=133065 RepID=UPI00217F7143|nr:heterogeneous nuclear ribonucleoprotein L-like [Adelges cooleyi]